MSRLPLSSLWSNRNADPGSPPRNHTLGQSELSVVRMDRAVSQYTWRRSRNRTSCTAGWTCDYVYHRDDDVSRGERSDTVAAHEAQAAGRRSSKAQHRGVSRNSPLTLFFNRRIGGASRFAAAFCYILLLLLLRLSQHMKRPNFGGFLFTGKGQGRTKKTGS